MEGCHVIIFISQNPNPNFLFSFHHHGSRRRTSSPRRPPLHHHHTIVGDAPATTAPPTAATVTISILFRASTNAHPTCTMSATTSLPSSSSENADARHTHISMAATSTSLARPAQYRHASNLHHRFLVRSATIATPFPSSRERSATSRAAHLHLLAQNATASTPPLHLQRVVHQRRLLRNHPFRSRNCSAPPQHHRSHVPRSNNHHAGNLTAAPSAAPSRGREESVRLKP